MNKKPRRSSASLRGAGGGGSSPPVCKFSFIIPAYCDSYSDHLTLSRCLDSVFAQTDPAWEIILVHDGENEKARMQHHDASGDPRARGHRFLYLESPYVGLRGGHQSINIGRDHARGEFTTILNGDNTIRPTYIEEMYDHNADVLFCLVKMNDSPGLYLNGRSLTRGRVDRLCYAIRTGIVRRVYHRMNLDADYDFLMECILFANDIRPVRYHETEKVLAEHN